MLDTNKTSSDSEASPSASATGQEGISTETMRRRRSGSRLSLNHWAQQALRLPETRVQVKVRGNNLHILCEATLCPARSVALPRLIHGLANQRLESLLASDQPQLYQVLLYGRAIGAPRPDWAEVIHLNQLPRYLERFPLGEQTVRSETLEYSQSSPVNAPVGSVTPGSAIIVSNRSLARQGNPEAIARYLSETLSMLGVAVKVSVKTVSWSVTGDQGAEKSREATLSHPAQPDQRLWITCESAYSPDPSLLAEPIAQRLRDLELQGFRDALVFSQVTGEAKPDWVLRVDLTPPEEMLREWARWGDVQAISRLLNQALTDQGLQVATSLKELTLHLTIAALKEGGMPDQQQTIAIVSPLLAALAPQGIHAATVYGRNWESGIPTETPLWVDWLDLPAAIHPALSESTLTLTQQGDRDAIIFLLTRFLNPDLDLQLATGGTRIQLLHKGDLLHIMTDAPVCPEQKRIGLPIARLLRPLQIPGVKGVRIYGRRAGQKRPLWSYGVDFAPRQRLVPEAVPEFAASDAYISDLIAQPGDLILRPDLTSDHLRSTLEKLAQTTLQVIQQGLLRSTLFTEEVIPIAHSTQSQSQPSYEGLKLALVWGGLGLFLLLPTDWVLGQMVRSYTQQKTQAAAQAIAQAKDTPAKASSSMPSPLPSEPQGSLKKSSVDTPFFNSEGFTDPDRLSVVTGANSTATSEGGEAVQLGASPLQAIMPPLPTGGADAYPTFNSRQLDEKLALYHQRLAISGPPDVLVIGSSRALRGIDPIALKNALAVQGYKNLEVFNFGINGATAQVVDLVIREILTPEQLPKLILWADGARAFNSGRVDVTYNAIAVSKGYKQLAQGKLPRLTPADLHPTDAAPPATGGMPTAPTADMTSTSSATGYQTANQWLDQLLAKASATYPQRDQLKTLLRENLAVWLKGKQSLPPPTLETQDQLEGATPSREASPASLLSEGQGMIDLNGFLPLSNRFNPATYYQKYARVSGDYDSDYESFQLEGKQLKALESLVQFTQAYQIPLVLVNLPLTQDYLDPVRRDYETEFQQQIIALAFQKRFVYLDMGQAWMTRNDYFSDPSHLNRYGAYAVSQRLVQNAMIPWDQLRKATSPKAGDRQN